ncbi:Rv3654c family TadE-like protein [Nocardioides sp. dk884]|uniref:Rv3654c family TadE-like protein n=1 Tax=Nocardioides sp. dk884 TaxID=2662361 RepID=UPI001E39999D|nr:Rv3654c family TadE-like protein [Nocardioides sp. dk884]
MTRPMTRDERGGASVLAVGLIGLLLLLGTALAAVTGLVVAHRQAQSAADLAALGAATALATGQDGCTRARTLPGQRREAPRLRGPGARGARAGAGRRALVAGERR